MRQLGEPGERRAEAPERSGTVATASPSQAEPSHQTFVLSHWKGERFVVVGGPIVKMHAHDLCRRDARSLSTIAAVYAPGEAPERMSATPAA